MNKEQLYPIALSLLERANGACVATNAETPYPFMRMMFNLRNTAMFPSFKTFFADKGLDLYFSTNTSLAKTAQLRKNPWCSMYYSLPDEFIGLMFAGKVEFIMDRQVKEALWLDGGERYYPQGVGDPDYTIFMMRPSLVRGWHKGEAVEFSDSE